MTLHHADSRSAGGRASLFSFGASQFAALLTVALVIGAATAVGVVTLRVGRPEILILVVLGSGCGLVSLTAAWMALGPFHWKLRMVVAPLTALVTMAVVAAVFTLNGPGPDEIGVATLLAGAAQFLALQASYWLFRWWLGLRMVHIDDPTVDVRSERFQYKLWEMLLVMTLVALMLGLGRGLVGWLRGSAAGGSGGGRELIVIFTLIVGYNLLLAWPLIWSVLSPMGPLWKTAIAVTLGLLVTATELPAAESFLGKGPDEFFWLINVPQLVVLLTHLIATRWLGYRLIRQRVRG